LEITQKFVGVPAHKISVAPDLQDTVELDDTYFDDTDEEYEHEEAGAGWPLIAGEEEGRWFEEYCDKMWE
jgi:hypothetical protein